MTERRFYYHHIDGQLGELVNIDGVAHIRLNRGSEEIDVPFQEGKWRPASETRKLNKHHAAEVSFAADRVLCKALGLHTEIGAKERDWMMLGNEERLAWATHGPKGTKSDLRMKLFKDIQATLAPHVLKGNP